MQQTDKYKFNLIEMDDTFSPDPLNENTRKLEEQLDAVRAEAAASDAALDQRLQVFEARHFETGIYAGTGTDQFISLGYTPKVVSVFSGDTSYTVFAGAVYGANGVFYLEIAEGGFWVRRSLNEKHQYRYLAAD